MIENRVGLDKFIDDLSVEEAVYVARRFNKDGVIKVDSHCIRGKHYACMSRDACVCFCHVNK